VTSENKDPQAESATLDEKLDLIVKYRFSGPGFGLVSGRALLLEAALPSIINAAGGRVPRTGVAYHDPNGGDLAAAAGGSLGANLFNAAEPAASKFIDEDVSNYFDPNGSSDDDLDKPTVHVRITARSLSGAKVKIDRWVPEAAASWLLRLVDPATNRGFENHVWMEPGGWTKPRQAEQPTMSALTEALDEAANEAAAHDIVDKLNLHRVGLAALFAKISASPDVAKDFVVDWKRYVTLLGITVPYYTSDDDMLEELRFEGILTPAQVDSFPEHVNDCVAFLRGIPSVHGNFPASAVGVGQMYVRNTKESV
jgi:hypothetical protein